MQSHQADERGHRHHLVDEGIHELTEYGHKIVAASNDSIGVISQASQEKPEESECLCSSPIDTQRRNEGQSNNQPSQRELVRQVHAGPLRKAGCFQIGTLAFSCSMMYWQPVKAVSRREALTRTNKDGSPTGTNPMR